LSSSHACSLVDQHHVASRFTHRDWSPINLICPLNAHRALHRLLSSIGTCEVLDDVFIQVVKQAVDGEVPGGEQVAYAVTQCTLAHTLGGRGLLCLINMTNMSVIRFCACAGAFSSQQHRHRHQHQQAVLKAFLEASALNRSYL